MAGGGLGGLGGLGGSGAAIRIKSYQNRIDFPLTFYRSDTLLIRFGDVILIRSEGLRGVWRGPGKGSSRKGLGIVLVLPTFRYQFRYEFRYEL